MKTAIEFIIIGGSAGSLQAIMKIMFS